MGFKTSKLLAIGGSHPAFDDDIYTWCVHVRWLVDGPPLLYGWSIISRKGCRSSSVRLHPLYVAADSCGMCEVSSLETDQLRVQRCVGWSETTLG